MIEPDSYNATNRSPGKHAVVIFLAFLAMPLFVVAAALACIGLAMLTHVRAAGTAFAYGGIRVGGSRSDGRAPDDGEVLAELYGDPVVPAPASYGDHRDLNDVEPAHPSYLWRQVWRDVMVGAREYWRIASKSVRAATRY